jgi:hypothetical protein
VGEVPVPEREEVELEGPTGLPSVLLELAPVLRETELVVELPVTRLTPVLLLAGTLGVKGR